MTSFSLTARISRLFAAAARLGPVEGEYSRHARPAGGDITARSENGLTCFTLTPALE